MPTEQALDLAQQRGLDLVEVASTAQPPVCRILDFGKYKYEQAKRDREGRKKQKGSALHEVKMSPNISKHDMDVKRRTAAKLLREGDKVKISVMFRGRQITHPEIGRERIGEIMGQLEEEGVPVTVEKPISMEGRFMTVIVAEDKPKAAAMAKEAGENDAQAADASSEAGQNGSSESAAVKTEQAAG